MKINWDSAYLLYICFLVMLIILPLTRNPNFAVSDMGDIKQILHPEHPKGELSYDPHHHHNYIAAFTGKWLGLEDNLSRLAGIFWFLEMGLLMLVLIKLCNFFFKKDKLILTLAVMLFIVQQPGTIDQHEMVTPLYLLAIYYFLKEKWIVSAIFTASIFYFHIGLAIWWFLPSAFGLAVIFLIQRRISLKEMFTYPLAVIIMASPIMYFYLGRVQGTDTSDFFVNYYYYGCWYSSSVIMAFSKVSVKTLFTILLPTGIFLVGYKKVKEAGYGNSKVMPIAMGVLILYILCFIFADILGNGSAITLQLLRSIINIQIFSDLFLAFLLARQIRKGNYIFFLGFVLLSFYWYNLAGRFFGFENKVIALVVFYSALLVYEICEGAITRFTERIFRSIRGKSDLSRLRRFTGRANQLLQAPVAIAIFLILAIIPKRAALGYFLNLPQTESGTAWTVRDYLYKDILDFTNEKMADEDAFLVIPFPEDDFASYSRQRVFITKNEPLYTLTLKTRSYDFEDVLRDDLNCPPDRLFENYSSENFCRIWQGLWENLDEDIIRRWKRKYKVTHVIREKKLPLNFPIVYENEYYVVYEID